MAATEAPPAATEPPVGQQDFDGNEVTAPSAPPEDLTVAGTTQLGLFDAGGKKPTHGKLSIGGMAGIDLEHGQAYPKGTYLRFEGIALVEEVAQRDKMDRKVGVAVDCFQKHLAHMSDLRVLGAVESGALGDSDAQSKLKSAVASLREQGLSAEAICGIAGLPVAG